MSISPMQAVQVPVLSGEVSAQKASQTDQPATSESFPAQKAPAQKGAGVEAEKEQERVEKATQLLNEFLEHSSIAVRFSTERESGELVVKVVKAHSGELIRQIPSEVALKLSKALDTLQGLIIKDKV